jgi:hypothetical protein
MIEVNKIYEKIKIILLFVVFTTFGTGIVYNFLVGNIKSMLCFGVLFYIVGQNLTDRIWML